MASMLQFQLYRIYITEKNFSSEILPNLKLLIMENLQIDAVQGPILHKQMHAQACLQFQNLLNINFKNIFSLIIIQVNRQLPIEK